MSLYIPIYYRYCNIKDVFIMATVLENKEKLKIQINYIEVYNRLILGYPLVFYNYDKISHWIKNNDIDSLNTVYFNIIRRDQIVFTGKLRVSDSSNFCFKDYLAHNLENMFNDNKISEEHFSLALKALQL